MARTTKSCPKCGGPMSSESKQCSECYAKKEGTRKRPRDLCACGRLKDKRAAQCYFCRHGRSTETYVRKHHPRLGEATFNPATIDPMWAASFAGFFAGEGSIQLTRRGHGLPGPVVSIHLRADDESLLKDIQAHIGGVLTTHEAYIHKDGYRINPQISWQLTGFERVKPVIQLLLACRLPAKKMAEYHAVQEYITWRESIGCFPTEEEREVAEQFRARIQNMKVFKVLG